MAIEFKYSLERSCIHRDNFESQSWTERLGGVVTDIVYSNGIASFNGSSSKIVQSLTLSGTYTVRLKLKANSILPNEIIIDFRNTDGSGYGIIYFLSDTGIIATGGTSTLYVNGVNTNVISVGTDLEIIISGITVNCKEVYIGSRYTTGNFFDGIMELIEIYEGTLTAEQVKNLYNNKTYKELPASTSNYQEVLSIDQRRGVIKDKYENAIVNTGVEVKRDGIRVMDFDGASYLNIDSVLPKLANTTTGTWMCWVEPFDAIPSDTGCIISFADTNTKELISILQQTDDTFRANNVNSGITQWVLKTDSAVFKDNTWIHLAVVQNGTEPILYIDGVAVAQTFITSTDKTKWFNDLTELNNGRIGNRSYDSGGEELFFNGQISQLKIYTGVLSAEEIMQEFTSTKNQYGL